MNNLLFDFSSGVQGRSPGRGLGEVPQLKVVTSKLYAFLVVIHTQYILLICLQIYEYEYKYEVETLIIENENYEAQLQSANSVPIRTTFILRMKNE